MLARDNSLITCKEKRTASLYNFKHLNSAIIMAYSQSDASRCYCLEGAFISFWICKSRNWSEYFKVLLNVSHCRPLERYFLTRVMNNTILVRDLIRISQCKCTWIYVLTSWVFILLMLLAEGWRATALKASHQEFFLIKYLWSMVAFSFFVVS